MLCPRCSSATWRAWRSRSSRRPSTRSSAATSSSTCATRGDARATAPLLTSWRPARPLDAERRQLGDAALAARRPLALHGEGNPRPDACAPLHEGDTHGDGRSGRLSHPRARPHGARAARRHAGRRARRARDRAAAAVAPRLPVRPRCDAAVISVVIPVKNGGADLARCLAGIAAQEVGEEVEVVVIDSGSTDGSRRACACRRGGSCDEIPPEEFGHGRTRNLGVELARGDAVVLHLAGRGRGRLGLARAARRSRALGRRTSRVRTAASSLIRTRAAGALLPRLHVRARPACPAARSGRRAHLRDDALLERQRRDPARDPRALPVPRRSDDERGPGVVPPRPPRWLLARLRATRGGPPFARVHRAVGVPAVLRLGRVGGARLRRGRRVARRAPARRHAVRAGGARMAVAVRAPALDSVHRRRTSSGSSPACSSGCATTACRARSSGASAPTRRGEPRARPRGRRSPSRGPRGRRARRLARRAPRS